MCVAVQKKTKKPKHLNYQEKRVNIRSRGLAKDLKERVSAKRGAVFLLLFA